MLRTIRLTLAVIFFALITLLFLDFTGTLHAWFGWMAKIQFLPAVLALNIGVVLFLAVLTLVFGRIYCSVICPLGVFQDIVSWLSAKRKKNRFRYSSALKWLRYGVLGVFVLAIIGGLNSFVVLLAPYSSFPAFSPHSTSGQTTDWPTWPNVLTAMPSMKRMYG